MAKILIAENEDIIGKHIKDVLESAGHEVTSIAKTGLEIIQNIDQNMPDLLITETVLDGDLDGLEVAEIIQSRYKLPIVFLTAYARSSKLIYIIQKGLRPYGYWLKPIEDKDLIVKISLILSEIIKSENIIIRSIEFKPKYHQAALNILTYFGNVVRQKYPDIPVKVKIEQEGLKVRLLIETPEGKKEKIEQTLEKYGQVVQGVISPDELFDNPMQVLELKQQLRLAYFQIENQKELLKFAEQQYNDRLSSLQNEVKWLRSHVGNVLLYSKTNINAFNKIAIQALKEIGHSNINIESAINILLSKIGDIKPTDETEVKNALNKIKIENNKVFQKVVNLLKEIIIKGTIAGASGNLLFEWIKSLL